MSENYDDRPEEAKDVIYVLGDTETAGFGEFKKPVEVALVHFDPFTFEPLRKWESLIDPECEIQASAQEIHGISQEDVINEPTMAEFIEHRLGGPLKQDVIFVAHNAAFDLPLLTPIGNIVGHLCTLVWARKLLAKNVVDHKLGTLREYFGLPETTAHRAMGDVETTLGVLKHLVELSGRTLPQLVAVKEHTVHTMPFGRYKGKLLHSLRSDYIDYILGLELDKNLRDSLVKVKKTRLT